MNEDRQKMKESTPITRKDPGFWRELGQQTRLAWLLMRDPEVPFYLKLLPFMAVIYLLSPIDLLTGIPLDDITALLVGIKLFIDMSPPHVVARHMESIREQDRRKGWDIPMGKQGDVADAIIIDNDDTIVDSNR